MRRFFIAIAVLTGLSLVACQSGRNSHSPTQATAAPAMPAASIVTTTTTTTVPPTTRSTSSVAVSPATTRPVTATTSGAALGCSTELSLPYDNNSFRLGDSLSALQRAGLQPDGAHIWQVDDGALDNSGLDNKVRAVISTASQPVVIGLVDLSTDSTICGIKRGASFATVMAAHPTLVAGIYQGRQALTDGHSLFAFSDSCTKQDKPIVGGVVVRAPENAAAVDLNVGIACTGK